MAADDQAKISNATVRVNTDVDPAALKDGEYTFAMGVLLQHRKGNRPFIGNAEANAIQDYLPHGYIYIGHEGLNDNSSVVMSASYDGGSEIGIFKDNKYTTVVNYAPLGFRVDKQMTIRYKLNYLGERIIYFTDDNMPPYWMNLDKLNYIKILGPDGCTLVDTADLDLGIMRIFKDYAIPCMQLVDTPETGSIPAGGYFITGQYANALSDGLTAWFHLIGSIPIFRESLSEPFEYIAGIDSEQPTNKAIKIKISGADLSFTHINIGIVKVVNGVKSAFLVATLPINTTEYTYTGIGNTEKEIALDEIIQPAIVYDTCRTLEVTNSELLLGNLKGVKDFNFQPYVSQIEVQWQVFKAWSDDKVNSFKNPRFAAYMKCFRQDEVYPLGLQFDLINGTTTPVTFLIGRKLNTKSNGTAFNQVADQFGNVINPANWDDSTIYNGDDIIDINRIKRHQIYNTATIEGTLDIAGTGLGWSEYGEMSYWESERTYPCDKEVWGDNAGKPIRYPKFPDSSIMHIHDGLNRSRKYEERVKLNYMGVRLPNIDVVLASLPAAVRATIKGYRLVVGDRTYSKSVIASGILFNARRQNWRYRNEDKDDRRIYPNYPLNDLRPDPYIKKIETNTDHNSQTNTIIGALFGGIGGLLGGSALDANRNSAINNRRPEPGNFHDDYLKDAFFFHSPDTHFKKEFLSGTELKLNVELYGKTSSFYDFVTPYPDFKEKGNDNDRAALQGTSIGWYNNFKPVKQNNIRHKLKESIYIPFNSRVSSGNIGMPVWNVYRESSVLLGTEKIVDDPTIRDTSRFILNNDNDTTLLPIQQMDGDVSRKIERDASLYYGSMKRHVPDQYGDIYDVRWIDTWQCRPDDIPAGLFFGGDTYLGQLTLKTQNVFYQNTKQFIDADNGLAGADFRTAETIAHTGYYYRNKSTGGSPRNQSVMMSEDNSGSGVFGLFGDGSPTALGYLQMMMYGIPCFWTESDFNIELRNPGTVPGETFYRNLNHGAFRLTDWLGVKTIDFDNKYYCNLDYSTKNNIKLIETISPAYDPLQVKVNHYFSRVLYSLTSQPEDIYDNWLRFKPLNYKDLSKARGELVSINYLGNYTTLFRMENSIFIDRLYNTLASTDSQIILGSGKMFDKEPEEFRFTKNGYGGSSAQWAFDSTEFGAFFPAPSIGEVFMVTSQGLKSITEGISSWLGENLSFILSRQIDIPNDNGANPEGIGMISGFDPSSKHWFLTKRDYEVINKAHIPQLKYINGRLQLDGVPVSLSDTTLFINRSWTWAYSPSNGWVSMQPFIPHAYLSQKNEFYAILNEPLKQSGFYQHNIPGVYNIYFGKETPCIVEGVAKIDGLNTFINPTISYVSQATDKTGRTLVRSFNKAIVYNLFECSGLLNLILQDELDLSQLFSQLANHVDSRDVALRFRDGHFNFSDYYDIYKHIDTSFFTDEWTAEYIKQFPIDKVLENAVLNYDAQAGDYALIREKWLKYRLILDDAHDIKLLLQFVSANSRVSVP